MRAMILITVLAVVQSVVVSGADDVAAQLRVALQQHKTLAGPIPTVATVVPMDLESRARATALRNTISQARERATLNQQAAARDEGHVALAAVTPGLEVYRRGNGTVRLLRAGELRPAALGVQRLATAESPTQRALRFLGEQGRVFRLKNPGAELEPGPEEADELGHVRVVFKQRYRGVPVWPAQLAAHFDALGRLHALAGAYVPTPELTDLTPRLTADDAQARAKARLPGGWAAQTTAPELIVFSPLEGELRLAWKFDLTVGFTHAWRLVIAADDGRVLHRAPLVHDASVTGQGVDLTGVTRPLNVWQQGSTYYLIDTSKPSFNAAFDPVTNPRGVITILDARNQPPERLDDNVFYLTSGAPNSWLVSDGVSAAFNFSRTYDYFSERHGRNSLDGQGGNISAIVRANFDNAFWNGSLSIMVFGNVKPYAASLDVVAHELAHGVTEKSANLIYQNQSGALNEAFSDIFGEMVEARVRGQNDWRLGSELATPLRDMKNPGVFQWAAGRSYPSRFGQFVALPNTPDGDNGGVHINSSIINHGFYLLAEGLPGAIGLGDAERIFYRALTRYLQSQSQFIDARLAAILSAEELFGADSSQARMTAEAFDAIEIGAAPATPDPTPVPVVAGEDSNLHVYEIAGLFGSTYDLYRREISLGDGSDGRRFARNVKLTRPAVSGDGELAVLVAPNHNLCIAETDDPSSLECLDLAGLVHSVALSPDGHWIALVPRDPLSGEPLGQIEIIDLIGDDHKTFQLVAPTTGNVTVDQILYADALTFTTDSKELVYDALSRVRFATGGAVTRWSICSLNIAHGTTTIITPPIEGINTGNPVLGRAGTRYLAFDAQAEADGSNFIVVADLFTGAVELVAASGTSIAYPAFTGDESAVVFAAPDGNVFGSGHSLFRQRLTDDRLGVIGSPTVYQSDARLGIIYRRGQFVGTNALPAVDLTLSTTNLALPGDVALTATASDSDGTVQRVEFYNGPLKIGEATSAAGGQFLFTWTEPPVGNHRLIARAVDNLGGAGDSSTVELTVLAVAGTEPRLRVVSFAAGQMSIAIEATPGVWEFQQSTNLAVWQTIRLLTLDASGIAQVQEDIGAASTNGGFFRLRKP